jgi:superfamily II DNA or RNA helicase
MACLPTGAGKTIVFAEFPTYFGMSKRLLVLAHREELLDQAADKLRAAAPALTVGIEQADRRANGAQVVVGSVQTLRGKRLEALSPDEFSLIVCDEAHHAVAGSYRRIFDHFGLFNSERMPKLVGFTATPRRGDGRSLGAVFEEIAFSRDLERMIGEGYLCSISGWRVRTGVSLDGVKVRGGDFVESQLAAAVNIEERNALVLKAHEQFARDRKCLVFCADVAHSQEIARMFGASGVRAAPVWGAMAKEERRAVLGQFRDGDLDVLSNCMVLTEGYDEPSVSCILMARPTQSRLLYAQIVGRGTRLCEGKRDLLVIDIADNSSRHTLAGLQDLFDLPESLDLRGGDALATARRMREISERMPWVDLGQVRTPDELEVVAERIDLFRFEAPPEISEATRLVWMPATGGGYRLFLPEREQIAVEQTLLGEWQVVLRSGLDGAVQSIGTAKDAAAAVRLADGFVRAERASAMTLLSQRAGWRELEPTEKQLGALRRFGLPTPTGLTRGQAAWMLSYTFGQGRRTVAPGPRAVAPMEW